ncbi:MAG TPA: hypothetical protein VK646_02990 [Actinomycetota bacterium]|nr:hypothetical protein [Actinomycetota bacterium]
MKRLLCLLATSVVLFAVAPPFGASAAASKVIVRPGHLAGWVPTSNGVAKAGRWDTGPGTTALGEGSVHLKSGSQDQIAHPLAGQSLTSSIATYRLWGSGFVRFWFRASNGASLGTAAGGAAKWKTIHAMRARWQWDCNGDGSVDGSGTVGQFVAACGSSTVTEVGFSAVTGEAWIDSATLGTRSHVVTYNFEPPTITIGNASVVEGNSGSKPMPFTLQLSGANQDPVRIEYNTSGFTTVPGRACPCEDFAYADKSLKINPGQLTGVVNIEIYGDTTSEPTEKFNVKLTGHIDVVPTGAAGTGTIVNDD